MDIVDILNPDPYLSHRFGVFFFAGGLIPNPIDFKFQKVQGISAEVQTETVNQGGQNLFAHRLPKKINYGNLVLERGFTVGSPLNIEFNEALSRFRFHPSNVLVTLFSEIGIPIGAWMYLKAYPVRWKVSDLDAMGSSVAVDTMELAYERFQIIRI
ncbi:MAG: phage tail protein [Bacteroidota bacterium]